MRFPDFFIVGAAKAGTSSLWYYLGQHPQIFMTKELEYKELGYFSKSYRINDKDEYLSFFKEANPDQKIGEACHPYLTSPESAELIKEQIPNAKIIIVLRNPITRAYSLYKYLRMVGQETAESFERALQLEEIRLSSEDFLNNDYRSKYLLNYSYIGTGMYSKQVERYINLFDEQHCKIFLYDDLQKDKASVFRHLCRFLQIDDSFVPDFTSQNKSHTVKSAYFQHFIRYRLPIWSNTLGVPKQLLSKLQNFFYSLNRSRNGMNELKPGTRTKLSKVFADDIMKTSSLIGRDLSHWLN